MQTNRDKPADPNAHQQWSLLRVILSFGFQPRKMSTRVGHIPLRTAFLVGVVSLVAGWIPVVFVGFPFYYLIADFFAGFLWYPPPSLLERVQLAYSISRESCIFSSFIVDYVILVSIVFFVSCLFAFMMSCVDLRWVRRHKRLAHCFRVCWLQLIQIPLLLMIAYGVAGAYYFWPRLPVPPTPALAKGSAESILMQKQKHAQERELYLKRKDIYSNSYNRNSKPDRHASFVCVTVIVLLFWCFNLKDAFAFRSTPRSRTRLNDEDHPICMNCEYDLNAQEYMSNCPECGEPVYESISHCYLYKNSQGIFAVLNPSLKHVESELG